MIIKRLRDIAPFRGGDASLLRELLHPDKDALAVGFSLAHAELGPGETTLPHRLTGAEVYYVLEGRGLMHVGDERAVLAAGEAVCIPPGAVQYIGNPGPGRLAFLCIVDPAWTPAGEEIL